MDHPSSPEKPVSIHPDVLALKGKAQKEGLETVWDRAAAQEPQCGFCELGLSCRICVMGPCRIDPFGDGPQRGVCGADADIMVARNLGRMVAAGAASHSDHGRDLVETLLAVAEGKAPGYRHRRSRPSWTGWPRSSGWPLSLNRWPRRRNWPWP